MNDMNTLYRINDVLTALASELGVRWRSEEHEDETLNELTHQVAAAFGLSEENKTDDRR
jgi:hypothetical protein